METRKSWVILFSVTITKFVGFGLIFGGSGVLVNEVSAMFEENYSASGWVGSIATATILLGSPISSFVVHYKGGKFTNILATVLTIGGMIAAAFSTQIWQIVLAYSFIAGLGHSAAYMSGMAMIPIYFDKHRHFALTVQNIGSAAGTLCFPFAVKELFQMLAFKYCMVTLASVFLIYLMGAFIYDGQKAAEPSHHVDCDKSLKRSIQQYWNVLFNHSLIVVFLTSVLWSAGANSNFVLLYPYMVNMGHSENMAALAIVVIGIGQLLTMVVLAMINAKYNTNKYGIYITANFILAIALLSVPFITNTAFLIGVAGIFSIGFGLIIANIPSIALHLVGVKDMHIVLSYNLCLSGLGAATGLPVAVAVQKHFGLRAGYYFLSASTFCSLLLIVLLVAFNPSVWKPFSSNDQVNSDNKLYRDCESNVDLEEKGPQCTNLSVPTCSSCCNTETS